MKHAFHYPFIVVISSFVIHNLCLSQVTFNRNVIIQQTDNDRVYSVFPADLDGDGDMDILAAYYYANKIAWLENRDGLGTFSSEHGITTEAEGARCVYAADLDGDGDLDVLSASEYDDKVAWYENVDGSGTFGPQRLINTTGDWIGTVFPADLDGDGDMDVISASRHDGNITWYKNTDSEGLFGPAQKITTEVYSVRSICTADLDNDGDVDLLSASEYDKKIAWYENYNTRIPFGPQQVISLFADGAQCVGAADLDGDGDMDVLTASEEDARITWYENLIIQTELDEGQEIRPDTFGLSQNYPNPFNTTTIIRFALSKKCFVTLKVYDLSGRSIEMLVNEQRNPGIYDILWDANDLPSGIYLYRIKAGNHMETRKLILQK